MTRSFEVESAALVLLAAALLLGCGSAPAPQPVKHAEVVRVGQGPAVALAGGTPSDGVVLGLYVDAGSRDGQAPFAAAIAAELLAESAGRGARGQAFPDGIEVLAVCDDGLRACAARLARGLSLRAPSDAVIGRALAKLKASERNARAGDPARGADELAVRALLSDDAAAFLPLELRGAASDRATFDAVRALIANAFGPSRALVAASGPVTFDELAQATQTAFAKVPAAQAQRGERELSWSDQPAVATGVDASAALSFAIAASSVERATRALSALRDELMRSKLARTATGHASSVRGGAIAVLRVTPAGSDVGPLVSRAGYVFERLRLEGVGESELPLPRDEPAAALRRLGTRFAAGVVAGDEPSFGLGVGVLVRGARGDRPNDKDPDAALRESERARLSEALRGGAALARPEIAFESAGDAGEAQLQNGARIAVHALSSDQIAIAVRLGAGAASDPPAQHGRAALLATAMTVACAGRSPAALRAELSSLGATLEPEVSDRALGITLRARTEHARAAIALAVECALQPSLARGDVTRARLELRERLGFTRSGTNADTRLPRGGAELRAAVATAVSSDRTPGALAPWGAMSTLASVDERALGELLDRALRGPSTSVAIVGALDGLSAEDAALLAARRMSRLPSQPAAAAKALTAKAPPPPAPRAKMNGKQPAPSNALPPQAVEALLVWSTPACAQPQLERMKIGGPSPSAADAARAFAGAVAAALSSAELSVPWLDGDCGAGVAWSAVLVRGPSERIAQLASVAAHAAARVESKAVLEAAARAAQKRIASEPSLAGHAGALAEERLAQAPEPGTAAEAAANAPAAVITRLCAALLRVLPAP